MTFSKFIPFGLFLIIGLIFSCSEKDDVQVDLNTINDDLAIIDLIVKDVTLVTAEVNWNIINSTGSDTNYSLYLNDVLLIEGLNESSYLLEDLVPDSAYMVKIIANNEFTQVESIIEFNTKETLYLSKLTFDNTFIEFIYNDDMKLELKSTPIPEIRSNFLYNSNGQITSQSNRDPYGGGQSSSSSSATHGYINDQLSSITLYARNSPSSQGGWYWKIYHYIEFSQNNTSYTRKRVKQELDHSGTVVFTQEWFYTSSVIYDQANRIISLIEIDDNTQAEKNFSFEYSNGNITRMDVNGIIVEVVYDDKKNFHTYESGFEHYIYSSYPKNQDVCGLLFLAEDVTNELKLVPLLYNHINVNNPLQYRVDGVTERTFNYEYNTSGYPVKVTTEGYGQIVLDY